MAEVVVDVLELVDVEKQQCHAPLPALAAGEHPYQLLLEPVPVEQAGERIAFGQIQDLVGGLPLARDVLEQPQVADQLLHRIAHRMPATGDQTPVAHPDLHGA